MQEFFTYCPADKGHENEPFIFGVVCRDPLILVSIDYGSVPELLAEMGSRQLALFVICSWHYGSELRLKQAKDRLNWCQGHQRHTIIHLANTPGDREVLDRAGIPAVFCSQNCFVDEDVFTIEPSAQKTYRAIYDAKLSPFKRHHLAAKIPDLSLITYTKSADYGQPYMFEVRRLLSHAVWLNGPFSRRAAFIPANEVAKYLNRSKTGLVLSEEEGANFASMQYLLCGLPVITTPSRGGRDVFFDPDYVLTVDPTSEAVAAGVEEMIVRNIDPWSIRRRTLEKVRLHRNAFLEEVTKVLRALGSTIDIAARWKSFFTNKMTRLHSIKEVRELL